MTTKQFKYNSQTLRNLTFWYLLPLVFSLSGIFLVYYFTHALGSFNYFLLLLSIIIFSTWFGGLKAGLFSTTITTLGAVYLLSLISNTQNLTSYLDLFLYITESVGLSVFIHKYLHTGLVTKYQQEIKQISEELTKSQIEAQRAQNEVKARDEFLSIASHELKTPLTSMLLQIQGAVHNIKNVSLANFSVEKLLIMLDSVEQQTNRLSKMINDLLNISLITTGKINLELEQTDLSQTVKNVAQRFAEKLEKENIALNLEAEQEILGYWDKLRLEQVISNLLANAIKYGGGKPIEVKVFNSGNTGKILVKDQGIGISKEDQKKIFGKFERATNTAGIQGFGVGLYITNQIVKAHSGKVDVTSSPGSGSTFLVELPLNKS